ncbi:MAG: 50S ribosomal protein L39e [Candidatus Micrarchaeota archaeon]|nr:50S ribosomal protein L39e [Candidatus Micrarchaeota archaeon]
MGKKSFKKKMMLGKRLKRNRRMPVLAMVRTHRKLQSNKFQRDWRHRKLKLSTWHKRKRLGI